MSGHRGPRLYCVRGTQKGSAAISWRNFWPWAPSPNAHTSARIPSPHPDPLWDTPKDTQKSPTGLCPVTLPSDARCSPDAYSHTIAALAFHPRHTITLTHARTRGPTFIPQGSQHRGMHLAESAGGLYSLNPIRGHRPHQWGTTLRCCSEACSLCYLAVDTPPPDTHTQTHTPACPRRLAGDGVTTLDLSKELVSPRP